MFIVMVSSVQLNSGQTV